MDDLNLLIGYAESWCKKEAKTLLMPQIWEVRYRKFAAGAMDSVVRPVRTIDSVVYGDSAVTVSPTSFITDEFGRARIFTDWPTFDPPDNGQQTVVLTVGAGYANADAVPPDIKDCLLQLVAWRYMQREAVGDGKSAVPLGVRSIVNNYLKG